MPLSAKQEATYEFSKLIDSEIYLSHIQAYVAYEEAEQLGSYVCVQALLRMLTNPDYQDKKTSICSEISCHLSIIDN